ncbi:MAG: hypothetical protein L7G97_06860 [Acidilobus sp.]|nr:hypothetical protein [Acidilobus sp.]MCG2890499.1 hypothetical protein [Acidilobus sp.]
MAKRINRTVAKLERLVGCEWAWVLAFMASSRPATLNDVEAMINECRTRGISRMKVGYDVCVERVSSILRELRFTRKQACLSAVFACLSARSDGVRVTQVLRACEGVSGEAIAEEGEAEGAKKLAEVKA